MYSLTGNPTIAISIRLTGNLGKSAEVLQELAIQDKVGEQL
jgi:hypothetical protein